MDVQDRGKQAEKRLAFHTVAPLQQGEKQGREYF
jgi:hypothetical protein